MYMRVDGQSLSVPCIEEEYNAERIAGKTLNVVVFKKNNILRNGTPVF